MPRNSHSALWQPGQSPNPLGRPKGARDKFSMLQARAVQEHGVSPLDFCMALVRKDDGAMQKLDINRDDVTLPMRLRAAELALPYVHRKMPVGVEFEPETDDTFTPAQLAELAPEDLEQLLMLLEKLQVIKDRQ